MFSEDPRETFRRHVWVAPFYEDDLSELVSLIGIDHIIFGSDFPHAEGLPDPLAYVEDLAAAGLDQNAVHKVMYENAAQLATPRTAT